MRYALAMVLVLAACQDDITTVFPDGLEPLEDNRRRCPRPGPASRSC
jgi:hypothetical protein